MRGIIPLLFFWGGRGCLWAVWFGLLASLVGVAGDNNKQQQQLLCIPLRGYTCDGNFVPGGWLAKGGLFASMAPGGGSALLGIAGLWTGNFLAKLPTLGINSEVLSLMCACGRVCFLAVPWLDAKIARAVSHGTHFSSFTTWHLSSFTTYCAGPLPDPERGGLATWRRQDYQVSEFCLLRRVPGRSDFYASVFVPYCAV